MKTQKPKLKELNHGLENDFESNKNKIKSNPKDAIERAKNNLEIAKELEKDKMYHVWISKEKTQKFIAKSKLKEYLSNGWKLNKIIK